jgi:hypothetical protein
MTDIFRRIIEMPAPFNMVVLIVLIITVGSIIKGVARYVRQYACHRNELEFKREMLERGMSAGEIEQVVKARGSLQKSDA